MFATIFIMLHHICIYGPISDAFATMMPNTSEFVAEYGRYLVQIFFVIGGFLASRSMMEERGRLGDSLFRRYSRLMMPFVPAILFAVLCADIARPYVPGDMVPENATIPQFIAHVMLLHSIAGLDSLSTGVWYVAIDFQLFVMVSMLSYVFKDERKFAFAVLALIGASLFFFNTDQKLDIFAPYFFGSYGMGILLHRYEKAGERNAFVVMSVIVMTVMLEDFRARIALAYSVALMLLLLPKTDMGRPGRVLSVAGKYTFSVFLLHFPVYMLFSALWSMTEQESPDMSILFMSGTVLATMMLAVPFHEWFEKGRFYSWSSDFLRSVPARMSALRCSLRGD